MGEEVFDLLECDRRQVAVVLDPVITLGEPGGGNGDELLIAAPPALVLHEQHPDDAATHDRAGDDGPGVGDDDVAGVAVARQGCGE